MDSQTVSVIIPVLNEVSRLRRCLDSIRANDYPSELVDIIVVDGGSTDGSQLIARSFPNVRLIVTNRGIARQLNLAIASSQAEIIVRADAHSEYARDYIRISVKELITSGAMVVGGAQRAVGETYIASAIAVATTSRFGAGGAKFRYSTKREWVETVYLGAWKRETLLTFGGYNESSAFDEDYDLNVRIRKAGGRVLLSPEIISCYFVRESLASLARQYFRYGKWKVNTLCDHSNSLRLRHLFPPAFVFALFISGLLAFVNLTLGLFLPAIYVFSVAIASMAAPAGADKRYFPALFVVFPILHVTYGAGFIVGIVRFGLPHLIRLLRRPLRIA